MSAVVYPGTFWVQIISSMALQLDEMTAKMSREYSEGREQVKFSLFRVCGSKCVSSSLSWYILGTDNLLYGTTA